MPDLDKNIYGIDSNDFAESISSDALSAKKGTEDIWGSALDQDAMSHGTSEGTNPTTNEVVKIHPVKSDSRAKSEGN